MISLYKKWNFHIILTLLSRKTAHECDYVSQDKLSYESIFYKAVFELVGLLPKDSALFFFSSAGKVHRTWAQDPLGCSQECNHENCI